LWKYASYVEVGKGHSNSSSIYQGSGTEEKMDRFLEGAVAPKEKFTWNFDVT
jgi:hypothetical protein